MRGKKWLIALAIVALIIAGFWLWWKAPNSSIKEEAKEQAEKLRPELLITSTNINNIDANKISATSTVVLTNNLPIEVKTNRLNYTIYIDSSKIIEDSYNQPITIRSKDTTTIKLPMNIMLDEIKDVLKKLESKQVDSADYSVRATFQVDVPIAGERDFTMNFSKRMPAFRMLKMKMGDVDLGKLGFKETDLNLTVNVTNDNNFPVQMEDGKFSFSLDDDKNMMEGNIQEVVSIPANSTKPISMHVDMKTMQVPKLGFKMLFDKKDTQFKLNYSSRLVSKNGMLDNSKMAFKISGTLDELKNAAAKK